MNEVGVADRARLLRSKKAASSRIVTSRKRKLRELFAVCDNEDPHLQLDLSDPDAPPTSVAEARFLEVTDILQDRLFDESNLPTRRQLRSDSVRQKPRSRKVSPDARTTEPLRKAAKGQRDGSRPGKSRATTPSSKSDAGIHTAISSTELGIDSSPKTKTIEGTPMQRSTSKGSQTDLPAEASGILDEIVEETFENASERQPPIANTPMPDSVLESERIRSKITSRPNSPGVDPRKAMPILAEDAANLQEPLIQGLGSHDEPHKAATAHLPPREVQENHLREARQVRENRGEAGRLSINPPRDVARNADVLSSPSSTIDAHSATTPAMHEASADTSPENESRYDVDRLNSKEDDVSTPQELKPSLDDVSEKEQHDRILQAQMDVSTAEILKDSTEEQLLDEQPGQSQGQPMSDTETSGMAVNQEHDLAQRLTEKASEVVQDIVEDEDEVVGVPTPGDEVVTTPEVPNIEVREPESKQPEVPDSEAEEEPTPVADPMDIDTTSVKRSFEGTAATKGVTATSQDLAQSPAAGLKSEMDTNQISAPPASTTPRRAPSTPAPAPLERMTTRVASGAMRHKSVSEILGEVPKPCVPGTSDSAGNSHSPSRSTTPQSPGARSRFLTEKAKEKERSKLSMVVFPKQAPKVAAPENTLTNGSSGQSLEDDYFMPLFLATASESKRGSSLDALLQTAHKTITTSNAYVPISENQTSKVLKRIYNLQSSNKWTLRQPKRSPEPIRPTSHWDLLLQEAKWMRTDFREEHKWKRTAARNLAYACAEWVECGPEDRKLLQVTLAPSKAAEPEAETAKDVDTADAASQAGSDATPDLLASGEFDSPMDEFDDEPRLNLLETVAPTAIFGLQDDDIVFGLRRSPATDKLLAELPMYGAPLQIPRTDLPTSDIDPDRFWRRPALPLSKYVEGRMELKTQAPPRKRSRFEYELEDEDEDQVVFGEPQTKRPKLPAESSEVALFDPDHKHIRDRIHSSHQFRPPSEFPMPQQTFFECRIASQWTWDEDNELKGYVREYSYNWSLISSLLGSKSLYVSGAERRTPWECFERWIHLEGLPTDMQKTAYFRAYTSRIEAANRNVAAQNNAIPQQQNANGQVQQVTPRRRPTTSVRVERRRNQKHLTLVDAMRKLAKKRETSAQKQAHAAGLAAMRKANEAPAANRNLLGTTPQDFSRLKFERDEAFRERVLQMQQRQEAARRANNNLQQQPGRNPANPQQPGLPNGGPPRPANSALPINGSAAPTGQNLTVPGQNRPPRPMPPQMPGQPMSNSNLQVPQMGMNGVPAAQMQGQMPMPNPSVDLRLVSQAHRISQHQQAIRLQQQGQMAGQSPQMHNSPPRMNGLPQPGFPMQSNMMPPFNSTPNGVSTPPTNSHVPSPAQGHAGSPRMGQNPLQHPNPGVGSSHVQILEQQVKQKFPTATPEQVRLMVSDQLSKSIIHNQHQRQGIAQSAMNAAAGAGGNAIANMTGMNAGQGTPQLYAQKLRQQQEQQQKAQQAQQQAAATGGNVSQGSGSGGSGSGGNSAQGHAHRGSSGSVQSGK